MVERVPFFYDVTLRDGNQALKRPWDLQEKARLFENIISLKIDGAELGYPGASEMDFNACQHLASLAPDTMVVAGLARSVSRDILKAWEALKEVKNPRIHIFITTSPYNMEHVLNKTPQQVLEKAREAVGYCQNLMKGKGSIEFSAEHFGDCRDNMDFVLEVFKAVVQEGSTVLNLPNTVERYRPSIFVDMVGQVVDAFPNTTISVHNHNDLGMATATTVESFFRGANQLETTLNGLGERAGNTNMYEVACSLHQCEVDVNLQFDKIYETAILVEQYSGIPIPEKAPIIGLDVMSHRSGIHQDGATKTKGKQKGAYNVVVADFIGRKNGEFIGFTNQSGKTAVLEIIQSQGLPITVEEAHFLQPKLKKLAELKGELAIDEIVSVYQKEIFEVEGPLVFESYELYPEKKQYQFSIVFNGKKEIQKVEAEGPIEAFSKVLEKLNVSIHLVEYQQKSYSKDHNEFASCALSEFRIQMKDKPEKTIIARAKDQNTVKANLKAMTNGVNWLLKSV